MQVATNKKIALGALGTLALIAGWAAFRPELLFVNKTVNESFPTAANTSVAGSGVPQLLESGEFRGIAHETKGTASIYRLPDGKETLRLTNFSTSNGPDVRVYLVAAKDVPDSGTVLKAGFVSLGSMKGNQGDQNYDVPADTDLKKYQSVSIWCARFSVNFAAAPLANVADASSGQGLSSAGSTMDHAHAGKGVAMMSRSAEGGK